MSIFEFVIILIGAATIAYGALAIVERIDER